MKWFRKRQTPYLSAESIDVPMRALMADLHPRYYFWLGPEGD